MRFSKSTAVIITAKDASSTIAKAVTSALLQDAVGEVVVVDDGSTDDTADVASNSDDGSGRLKIIRLEKNRGPSYGRNAAISASTCPYLCILDADDFMTEGRVGRLLEAAGEGWDLVADNLLFASQPNEEAVFDTLIEAETSLPLTLTLASFVKGNVPRRHRYRRELGFLKPLIRRSFVETHNIIYDENLRLGEDMVYFSHCLLNDARFVLVPPCGYIAVQSENGLSGRHNTADIKALHSALLDFKLKASTTNKGEQISPYLQSVRKNLAVRLALDAKRNAGWRGFFSELARSPEEAAFVMYELVTSKLTRALKS